MLMYEYVAFKLFEYKLNEFRGNLKFMNPEKMHKMFQKNCRP